MKTYFGLVDGQEIPDGYDHYIWASERCLEGIKWCKENNKDYEVIPKNWVTEEEIYGCIDYLEAVKEELLDYAIGLLEEYHSLHYDRSQWNILLEQWFSEYLTSYYDKFLKIKWVIENDIECESSLYSVPEIVPSLDYMEHHMLLLTTDSYHLYQYSRLLNQYGSGGRITVIKSKKYTKPCADYSGQAVPKGFKNAICKGIINALRIFKKKDAVIIQNSYLRTKLIMLAMIKNPGKVYDLGFNYNCIRSDFPLDIDERWRRKDAKVSESRDEFTGIMKSLLKMELPLSCIENLKLLQRKGQKIFGKNSVPKAVLYSASGITMDELFKVYLMDVKKKGTLLCGVQHGADYCNSNTVWWYKIDIKMSDRFYTWGWTDEHGYHHLKPMPMVKCLGRSFTAPGQDMDILYVTTKCEKNISRVCREAFLFDEYIQGEKKFFAMLDRECLRKIRFRTIAWESGIGTDNSLRKDIPELRFDHVPDFYESLNDSRLVVVAGWSTTLIEALYADRPVLVRNDMQGIRPEAMEDLEEMERVGILCRTFEELAERLNQIYDNVEEWWNEPDRQRVVKRFKERYAWMPSDAEEQWLKEIRSLYTDIPLRRE